MADKDINSSKLPYIVLPSLSSEENIPKRHASKTNSSSKPTTITRTKEFETNTKLPTLPPRKAAPLSPRSITSTKALNRHIALSKQFVVPSFAKSVKEIQATQKRILLAHYEMRKSPRSFYPPDPADLESSIPMSTINEDTVSEDRFTNSVGLGLNQLLKDNERRVTLENLAQIFPHRVRKPRNNDRGTNNEKPTTSTSSSDENLKMVAAQLAEMSKCNLNNGSDIKELSSGQIRTRLDGLTVHIQSKNAEVSQLKQDLIDLQLLVLKEKKESEKSRSLGYRLQNDIRTLENKIESLECIVSTQEKSILDKLLLLDGMDTTDSDSDFGTTYCKPSNWSPPQSQSQKPIALNLANSASGTVLKECNNWIPIAPDFDKLINIISMMNIRMDRNQSMKLHKKGNAVSFQHSDTINLTLFKNGLILGSSGFRNYTSLSVIKLINEIFQGYFPSELQSQYPDGVVFVIYDKRSAVQKINSSLFYGEGNKLNDSKSTPKLVPGVDNNSACVQTDEIKVVEAMYAFNPSISNSSLQSNISILPSNSNLMLASLPTLNSTHDNNNSLYKMIVLKLKNSASGNAYRLQVSNSSSVNDLLNHLETNLPDKDEEKDDKCTKESCTVKTLKYELVLPMPYGILNSGNSSLKEYGMIHNTLLYFQPSESNPTK